MPPESSCAPNGQSDDISLLKARVYNPGELAGELARFESGTSYKLPPSFPSSQSSVQSHVPTSFNRHLAVGLSREEEMPEHDAAIQLNLARSRQEVMCRYNNTIRLLFKIKPSVLTHISQKRQRQALLLILWSGILRVVIFDKTDL